MKSPAVATASATAQSPGATAAANDERKMASAKATETEEDFPKLTSLEREQLAGVDRLDEPLDPTLRLFSTVSDFNVVWRT